MKIPFSEVKKALYNPCYNPNRKRVNTKKDVNWDTVDKRFNHLNLKEVESK